MNLSSDCLFCKMVQGVIPVARVFEDDSFICIRDIQPQAKIHLLMIPKLHLPTLTSAFPESGPNQRELMGKMLETITEVASQEGLLPGGFRTVINTEKNGGQTVYHLHAHILGGEPLNGRFG